jgi:hypothetical protein
MTRNFKVMAAPVIALSSLAFAPAGTANEAEAVLTKDVAPGQTDKTKITQRRNDHAVSGLKVIRRSRSATGLMPAKGLDRQGRNRRSGQGYADDGGCRCESRQAKALDEFNNGTGGFLQVTSMSSAPMPVTARS